MLCTFLSTMEMCLKARQFAFVLIVWCAKSEMTHWNRIKVVLFYYFLRFSAPKSENISKCPSSRSIFLYQTKSSGSKSMAQMKSKPKFYTARWPFSVNAISTLLTLNGHLHSRFILNLDTKIYLINGRDAISSEIKFQIRQWITNESVRTQSQISLHLAVIFRDRDIEKSAEIQ